MIIDRPPRGPYYVEEYVVNIIIAVDWLTLPTFIICNIIIHSDSLSVCSFQFLICQ